MGDEMRDDSLSPMFRPNLVGAFDQVPYETPVSLNLTKGQIAELIRSQLSLLRGLVDFTARVHSLGGPMEQTAFQVSHQLNAAYTDFARVADDIMLQIVMDQHPEAGK